MKEDIVALATLAILLLTSPLMFTRISANGESECYIVAEENFNRLSVVTPDGVRTIIYQFSSGTFSSITGRGIGIRVDSSGNIIVAEGGADILSKVTPAGERSAIYKFHTGTCPHALAIDSTGNYIVSEWLTHVLSKITPEGVRTAIYRFPGNNSASGLAIDSSGNYIIADGINDMLWKITPEGVRTAIYRFPVSTQESQRPASPEGLAVDSSRNYIVVEEGNDTLSKITPDGVRTVIYLFHVPTLPTDVAIDSSGNYIVSEWIENILSKITPDGVRTVIYTFESTYPNDSLPASVACTTMIYTELSCFISKDIMTEGDSMVVSGFIKMKATLTGRIIRLTYRRPDGSTLIRTVTTGSDGSYSDSYLPDATGSWSVTASWDGDSEHGGATSSSKSFRIDPKPFIETPLGIITIGVVMVAAIILVLRKRSRKV